MYLIEIHRSKSSYNVESEDGRSTRYEEEEFFTCKYKTVVPDYSLIREQVKNSLETISQIREMQFRVGLKLTEYSEFEVDKLGNARTFPVPLKETSDWFECNLSNLEDGDQGLYLIIPDKTLRGDLRGIEVFKVGDRLQPRLTCGISVKSATSFKLHLNVSENETLMVDEECPFDEFYSFVESL